MHRLCCQCPAGSVCPSQVLDEETCCELCRTTVGCLKWTLKTAAGVHVDQGCHVKSAVGSHNIGEVGVTSGDVAPK